MWKKTINLTEIPQGSFRSIAGYAGESLVIGRALLCGYNLFFKAWRDAKYDAVLDSNGTLFRIEIKQTTGDKEFSVTSGGRTGKQIDKSEGMSRESVLSTGDCDFVIATQSMNAECWIVPVEVIEILGRKTLTINSFLSQFKERWGIFNYSDSLISSEEIRKGLRSLQIADLEKKAEDVGIDLNDDHKIKIGERKVMDLERKEWIIVKLWMEIYKRALPANSSIR